MSESECYRLANQKLLHELEIIDKNLDVLKNRALAPPCITMKGFDKLKTCTAINIKQASTAPYKDVIYKLFMMLKIPQYWIHSITHHFPSTVNIYLVTDSIKVKVYQTILEHLIHSDQQSVSIKLLTA